MRGLAIAFLAVLIGYMTPAPAEADSDTIVLGSVLSLTGRYEVNGQITKDGYELAIKRINEMGGVSIGGKLYQLKVKYLDDKSDRKRAAQLAERLIKQDGVKFMLGPYSSGITKSVSQATEKYKVPIVVAQADSSSLFMRGFNYIFGVRSTSDQYFASAIDLAAELAEKEGRKSSDLQLAIISENDPFSNDVRMGAVETARRYGMRIVIDDVVPINPRDVSSSLRKLKSAKPDILLFRGRTKGTGTVVRQIQNMKIQVPLIALTHCEAAHIVDKIGKAAEGLLCATQWSPRLTYEDKVFGSAADYANTFMKSYKRYKVVPFQAAAASAAVLVYKDAFERAGSLDPERVRIALAATDMPTFFGQIKLARNGQNIGKPMVFRQIQKGKFEVVAPTKWAPSPVKYPRIVQY